MNCPICDKEMKRQSWNEEHYIVEYKSECPDGCYYEHYVYGSTEIQIAGVILSYHHSTPENELKYIGKQINILVELEKEYRANGNKI